MLIKDKDMVSRIKNNSKRNQDNKTYKVTAQVLTRNLSGRDLTMPVEAEEDDTIRVEEKGEAKGEHTQVVFEWSTNFNFQDMKQMSDWKIKMAKLKDKAG